MYNQHKTQDYVMVSLIFYSLVYQEISKKNILCVFVHVLYILLVFVYPHIEITGSVCVSVCTEVSR